MRVKPADSVSHATRHWQNRRAEENQGHGDVHQEHVLGHVEREQATAKGVDWGDEGEEKQGQADCKRCGAPIGDNSDLNWVEASQPPEVGESEQSDEEQGQRLPRPGKQVITGVIHAAILRPFRRVADAGAL